MIVKALAAMPDAGAARFRHRRQYRGAGARQRAPASTCDFGPSRLQMTANTIAVDEVDAWRAAARNRQGQPGRGRCLGALHQPAPSISPCRGNADVIVTAPINKEAMNLAGHHFDGHTGLLAHLTGSKSSFMLLASERLNTIHVSTHISLKGAIERAKTERVLATIEAGPQSLHAPRQEGAHRGCRPQPALRRKRPVRNRGHRIPGACRRAGAEPRASMSWARSRPIRCLRRAYNGAFDLVIAQYHDQGHIPIKLVAFETAVNVSLGLPIDRVSVDHGTAFDIAGTGKRQPRQYAVGHRLCAADGASPGKLRRGF